MLLNVCCNIHFQSKWVTYSNVLENSSCYFDNCKRLHSDILYSGVTEQTLFFHIITSKEKIYKHLWPFVLDLKAIAPVN